VGVLAADRLPAACDQEAHRSVLRRLADADARLLGSRRRDGDKRGHDQARG
jgi:hypothetical protein